MPPRGYTTYTESAVTQQDGIHTQEEETISKQATAYRIQYLVNSWAAAKQWHACQSMCKRFTRASTTCSTSSVLLQDGCAPLDSLCHEGNCRSGLPKILHYMPPHSTSNPNEGCSHTLTEMVSQCRGAGLSQTSVYPELSVHKKWRGPYSLGFPRGTVVFIRKSPRTIFIPPRAPPSFSGISDKPLQPGF